MSAPNKKLINNGKKKGHTPQPSYFNGANVSNFSAFSAVNSLSNFVNITNANKNLGNQENLNITQTNVNINRAENCGSINEKNDNQNSNRSKGNGGLTFSNSTNSKKLIIFRKLVSKSPDKIKLPHFEELLTGKNLDSDKSKISQHPIKIPNFELLITDPSDNKVNIVEKFQTISNFKIYLNELLTLKKSKITSSHGIVKKMLHAPSFRIYDVQEEPITEMKGKENIALRDRINFWRINLCQSKYLQKIYNSYWNSPEGCISVVMEPAKRGYLSVINRKI